MQLSKIYFSAAGTTKKIIEAISQGLTSNLSNLEVVDYSLIKADSEGVELSGDDIAIFAVPVYSGRVPAVAAEKIRSFKGNKTKAVVAVVYGNREFDDALLELRDIVLERGFVPIAGGAFVAEHSIFPKVATARPNEDDLQIARDFGAKAAQLKAPDEVLSVPGNKPYKVPGGGNPLVPKTNKSKCVKAVKKDKDLCGICAAACPVAAIGSPKPSTNSDACIKCAHCISVCPYDAREWGGLLYKIAEKKFVGAYSKPKFPELFY